MKQIEWIFHACGCRKPHRIWGSEKTKEQQREFYRGRRCSDCEEARDKLRYGRLQPIREIEI